MEYNKPQGFDTRVEIMDPKTGTLVAYNPYSLTCERTGAGSTRQVFERDGVKYWPDGSLVQEGDLLKGKRLNEVMPSEPAEKGKKATPANAS